MRAPPPPPPRRRKRDTSRRLNRLVAEEERERERKEKEERRFDPYIPPDAYARPHHFAVNEGDDGAEVFDLDAEGIALPGHIIRGLGEYAQGNGAARQLYVAATDLKLVKNYDVYQAAEELKRQNERLNSSELDKLVSEMMNIAHTEGEPDEQWSDSDQLPFSLTEQEHNALGYIARRYGSAEILYDAYDDEARTIPRSAVLEAFLATRDDGGDLGTVPLAGGSLDKKIRQLWDEAEAMEYVLEMLEEAGQ